MMKISRHTDAHQKYAIYDHMSQANYRAESWKSQERPTRILFVFVYMWICYTDSIGCWAGSRHRGFYWSEVVSRLSLPSPAGSAFCTLNFS